MKYYTVTKELCDSWGWDSRPPLTSGCAFMINYSTITSYVHLILYSTATQNHLCWLRPPPPQFRVKDTTMLVSKNATPKANAKVCVIPNANPQHEQVEYRWRWVPNTTFSQWPCRFHVVCASFSKLATQKLANTEWYVLYRRGGCE